MKRVKLIALRVNEAELENIRMFSAKDGRSVSSWVRKLILQALGQG